jgi:hypothetical protein
MVYTNINSLSVPVSRPIDLSNYFGWFGLLGPYWQLFITTAGALGFIYLICYLIMSQVGLFSKFKDLIKWW